VIRTIARSPVAVVVAAIGGITWRQRTNPDGCTKCGVGRGEGVKDALQVLGRVVLFVFEGRIDPRRFDRTIPLLLSRPPPRRLLSSRPQPPSLWPRPSRPSRARRSQ
jgi:hypothetical protein